MKTQFKPGDRVIVYGNSKEGRLERVSSLTHNGYCGEIKSIINEVWINVALDREYGCQNMFHYKQCRRLVKRKRREIFVNYFTHGYGEAIFNSEEEAKRCDSHIKSYVRTIRFVEAKEK